MIGSVAAGLIGMLAATTIVAAPTAGEGPVIVGPAERVFDWSEAACARWDIPDAPARAWRDAAGAVRLIAGAEATRAAAGPSLGTLAHECHVLHRGSGSGDPGAFDDRTWIASVFAAGGTRVEALGHMEYHGHLRPGRCAGDGYAACWMNAIVALDSTDGGRSFARAADGDLVAALPYPYDGALGRRAGYFNPSNILRDGDYLYAFVFAEAYRAQRRGPCLMRRPVEGRAADWRAWDGRGFSVRFASPYREAVADPAAHVCAPVPGVGATISSVARAGGRFLAVTPAARRGPDGSVRSGVWWMVSDDLVAWSTPQLLLEVPLLWRRDCAAPAAFAYPSLIDDDGAGPNFDAVDDAFWLYLVEAPLDAACRVGPERDLVRYRVSWPRAAAPRR